MKKHSLQTNKTFSCGRKIRRHNFPTTVTAERPFRNVSIKGWTNPLRFLLEAHERWQRIGCPPYILCVPCVSLKDLLVLKVCQLSQTPSVLRSLLASACYCI